MRAPASDNQPARRGGCPGFITALVLRCGAGDVDALARLFDLFYAPVTHRLAGLVPEGQVDDVVAEVLTMLWREAPSYQGGTQGGPVAWVLGLADTVAASRRTPVGC